jgi:hypothetical protein
MKSRGSRFRAGLSGEIRNACRSEYAMIIAQLKVVMAGLDPWAFSPRARSVGIHVVAPSAGDDGKRVDARVEPAHDELQLVAIKREQPLFHSPDSPALARERTSYRYKLQFPDNIAGRDPGGSGQRRSPGCADTLLYKQFSDSVEPVKVNCGWSGSRSAGRRPPHLRSSRSLNVSRIDPDHGLVHI